MLGLGLRSNTVSGGLFSPYNIFSDGSMGGWYDPADISTLFQDSSGTVPVVEAGDPVGKVLDKSGNNLHLVQETAASKPIYRVNGSGKAYLEFDGVDDGLSCPSFDMSATDGVSIFSTASKISEAAVGTLVELSSLIGGSNGTFLIGYPSAIAAQNCLFGTKGTTAVFQSKTSLPVGTTPRSIIALSKITTPVSDLRIDDLTPVVSASSQGTGNFGNHTLYVGRRAGTSNPLHGNIYSLIIVNKYLDENTIANLKRYIQVQAGI